jgi:hypothetical protein
MKQWHYLLVIVLAFVIGALYPKPVAWVRGKVGV